jgi:hypothetical protein
LRVTPRRGRALPRRIRRAPDPPDLAQGTQTWGAPSRRPTWR